MTSNFNFIFRHIDIVGKFVFYKFRIYFYYSCCTNTMQCKPVLQFGDFDSFVVVISLIMNIVYCYIIKQQLENSVRFK